MNIAISEEIPITKNRAEQWQSRAEATIPIFGEVYTVQFEFKVTGFEYPLWCNILHITTGGNGEDYGNRIASAFLRYNVECKSFLQSILFWNLNR